MIYIIFGASGSGKSTLLNIIKSHYGESIDIHTKATTRRARMYDNDEIISFPQGIPENQYKYIYSQYGYDYGISDSQINVSLQMNRLHFIICNDVETIEKLKLDYPDKVKVIFLRFNAPKEVLESIQKTRKINDDEIGVRLNKIQSLNQIFIERSNLFDEVIKNNFGDNPEKMIYQIDRIIKSNKPNLLNFSQEDIKEILAIIKSNDKILKETKEQNKTIKNFVFIIMAMLDNEPVLNDIHSTIKRVARNYKFQAGRVEDYFDFQQVDRKILNHIKLAEYIIADLTFERPNCYYEIGFAHALEKKVILTAMKPTKVHFDISTFPIIFYDTFSELERRLKDVFKRIKQNNIFPYIS
jgi:guanylate kinase